MKKHSIKTLSLISILFCFIFSMNSFAMDAKQRLAIIKGLKLKGIVGENNKGYLEFRSGDTQAQAVVNEENGERSRVYEEIAGKSGASTDSVGEQRASQIASSEASGVWIQDANGNWHKK